MVCEVFRMFVKDSKLRQSSDDVVHDEEEEEDTRDV